MRKGFLAVLGTILLLNLGFSTAWSDFQDPKIVLHMVQANALPPDCSGAPTSLACNNNQFPEGDQIIAVTQGDTLVDYQIYIMLADVDSSRGVREITFGLSYERGVTVTSWLSCAAQATPSQTWPDSGSEMTLRFESPDTCARPQPDPDDQAHFGVVPMAVLIVRASEPALLKVVPTSQGVIPLTDCSGIVSELPLDFGLGEIGFGYKIGWDPCNYNPFAHGCGVFFDCICCLPSGCRPTGDGGDYSVRDCINDRGSVIVQTSDCGECSVPAWGVTWGMLKVRYR